MNVTWLVVAAVAAFLLFRGRFRGSPGGFSISAFLESAGRSELDTTIKSRYAQVYAREKARALGEALLGDQSPKP